MSQQIIREIPLIRRYTRHNEAEDTRFRAWLKTECSLSNPRLDEVVRVETDEVWRQIDCLKCANCCRTMKVVVDRDDIQRLSTRLGITVRMFRRCYVTAPDPDGSLYLSSQPCPFLGDDNYCGVYDHRPQACRDFPYLHAEGFRRRTLMMLVNCETCPIVFNVWQALKQRLRPRRARR